MTLSQKTLLGFFIVLILVIITELGYLIYYKGPLYSSSSTITSSSNTSSKYCNIDPVVFITAQNTDAFIKKGIITSAIVTNTYEGYIVKINNSPSLNPDIPSIKSKASIRLKKTIDSSLKDYGFFFDENELKHLVIKNNKTQEKTSNLRDLKVGDRVSVLETFDLAKKNTILYTITIF